jgi:predicted small lipoprotein YifL
MKFVLAILALAGLLGLAAGCSSEAPVYFASAAQLAPPPDTASAPARSLNKDDEKKIQQVVYSYLLERHFWEGGDYSALFVQAEDDVVGALIKKYPQHVPPIKHSYHIDLRQNQSPRDKDTGLPVMILGADVGEPNADGTVDVVGRWYAGAAVQGFYTFLIIPAGSDWTIGSVR